MDEINTTLGTVKRVSRLYVTAKDVVEIMGCKNNKAYETIRNVNQYAKKKGLYPMSQGRANKYLFAEMYGFPQEEVNDVICQNEEVYRMAYFNVCSVCGCTLDPGEKCDCQEVKKNQEVFMERHMRVEKNTKQLAFVWDHEVGYENKVAY